MTVQPPDPMVRFLVELEQPYDPDRDIGVDRSALIRFALLASDYWADHALAWLEAGSDVPSVSDALREVSADRSQPHANRHRALALLRHA